jgi:hypothetical membrane protein
MAQPEPRLGPLVHRSVHHGAALWVVGVLQFLAVMIVVQFLWAGSAPYNLSQDVISDLGNTQCGNWPTANSTDVCSPWHDLFNGSAIVLGLLFVFGTILLQSAFPRRTTSTVGLFLFVLAGIGAIGVGASPENVDLTVHRISAAVAFGAGSFALFPLSLAMFRDTRWDGFRAYTLFSGLVGFVAFLLFIFGFYPVLGVGGMERLIVAPVLLWAVVAGAHLLFVPAYAPRILPKQPNL